jgi:hypothetical protein
MQSNLEILIPQFGETDDAAVQQRAVADYRERLRSYPGGEIKGTVATRNIGKGADWIVVAISFAGLFFTIPKAHKVVRESWEEWQRIYKEIKAIFSWLVPHQPAYYPDGYLFLVAVSELVKDLGVANLTFIGLARLPEDNPDFAGREPLLFTFRGDQSIEQVAVARHGVVFWRNCVQINDTGA